MELLAPAGDWEALKAALEAGANAVYLGFAALSARQKARNFSREEINSAVILAQKYKARVYLALNIDLGQRELSLAARIMECAHQAGVHAILVKDPALFSLIKLYPNLRLHFSTQTCMTSSADVRAAQFLGATRVVLARELALDEIAAASAVGLETEVFAQGSLCFSISGRCLLSSWVGGRSGNRGACTSTCRVPWSTQSKTLGTPFSMHDLCVVDRLGDLSRAGVHSLKIEGRLKTAPWVFQAVKLYRQSLDDANDDVSSRKQMACVLGDYTGRQLSCGFLDRDFRNLTGLSTGRMATREAGAETKPVGYGEAIANKGFCFDLQVNEKKLCCQVSWENHEEKWSLAKSEIKRRHKAIPIEELFHRITQEPIDGTGLLRATCNQPSYLLAPRIANSIHTRIAAFVRRTSRNRKEAHVDLPPSVRQLLQANTRCEKNHLHLGCYPNRIRIEAIQAGRFLQQVPSVTAILEATTPHLLQSLLSRFAASRLVVALPAVFFDSSIPDLCSLLSTCQKERVTVEVNSWGGWWLARNAEVTMESGPGIPVLNSLAAQVLHQQQIQAVTLSVEADRQQLEDITASCPVPCSLIVYGRPALAVSRVDLEALQLQDQILQDRRDTQIRVYNEEGLWVLRPANPLDLRKIINPQICVRHLVVDLAKSPDPMAEWNALPARNALAFNYFRRLA